jgi:hypothetical protein
MSKKNQGKADGVNRDAVETGTAELDGVLRYEDPLLPSSGFAAAVMDLISEEAAAPAPLQFPWKLAIPGMVALAAGVVLLIWQVVKALRVVADAPRNGGQGMFGDLLASHSAFDWAAMLRSHTGSAVLVVMAVLAAYLCVALARRMSGQTQS